MIVEQRVHSCLQCTEFLDWPFYNKNNKICENLSWKRTNSSLNFDIYIYRYELLIFERLLGVALSAKMSLLFQSVWFISFVHFHEHLGETDIHEWCSFFAAFTSVFLSIGTEGLDLIDMWRMMFENAIFWYPNLFFHYRL